MPTPVRFTRLEARRLRIPFRFSFTHSLAERRVSCCVTLALTAEGPFGRATGYGEALPRAYLTGETLDTVRADLDAWWPAIRGLRVEPSDSAAPILDALAPYYQAADARRRTAAWAALDIACVDAYARACRIPSDRLLRLPGTPESGVEIRPEEKKSWTLTAPVGGGSPRKAAWTARGLKLLGFSDFKLKTGHGDDAGRLAAVRRALGPDRPLRVDANAGYAENELDTAGELLRRHHVGVVEQPVPAGDAEALARAGRKLGLPVMADESLCTQADADALLEARAAEFWNVRLGKNGGFSGLLALARKGRAAGVKGWQLGVLVGETAILAAAQRAAAFSGWADWNYVEYGFPDWLLAVRPYAGAPPGRRGVGAPLPSGAFGLGVNPRPGALERVELAGGRIAPDSA